MSFLPSNFQILPYHIIEEIFNYPLHPTYNSKREIQLAIMHTCQRWRAAYMRKHLSAFSVYYEGKDTAKMYFKRTNLPVDLHLTRIDQYVCNLTINVPSWSSVMIGEVVQWMKTSPVFSSISFASVTTLTIYVPYDQFYEYDSSLSDTEFITKRTEGARNAVEFFRYVKALTPNANSIKLFLQDYPEWEWDPEDRDIQLITKTVVDLASNSNLTLSSGSYFNFFEELEPTAISGLTSFCFNPPQCLFMKECDPESVSLPIEIVRHNARTLKSLTLPYFDLNGLDRLLFNEDLPIIYPLLSRMDIEVSNPLTRNLDPADLDISRRSCIRVDHFPALEYLKFTGPYALVVRHLFKSDKSLKYLDLVISIDLTCVSAMNNPNPPDIFTRFSGLKTIRFATLGWHIIVADCSFQYKQILSYILRSIAAPSSVICNIYMEFPRGSRMTVFLDDNSLWTALRRLYIPSTQFSFTDVIRLLQKTSVLQRLACALDNNPPSYEDVDLFKDLGSLKDCCYPLSNTLSELVVTLDSRSENSNLRNISWSALLLTNLCPRVAKVGISKTIWFNDKDEGIYVSFDRDAGLDAQIETLFVKTTEFSNIPLSFARRFMN